MDNHIIELGLYQSCLYEIKKRVDVISDHINKKTTEKYLIIEVETVCLQFRKILEKIMLMSLVANKEAYAAQNEKYAKHYHAELIMKDLERINPDFYPVPLIRIKKENDYDELKPVENGYLTKDELIQIYEICGGMMHAQNPFSAVKPIKELQKSFPVWLTKIVRLLNHHQITLFGGELMVVALMERADNGLPQAVIFEKEELNNNKGCRIAEEKDEMD